MAEQLNGELPSERQAIQEALSKVGLYNGNREDRFNSAVRHAIRDFQLHSGAPATGFPTIQQMAALYEESRYQTVPKPLPQVNIIDLLRRSGNKEPAALLLRAKVHDHTFGPGPLPKDMTEAIRFYRMAAKAQDAEAALALGGIYRDCDGIGPNPTQVAKWLKRAAEAGLPESQYALGEIYLDGTGVSEDQAEAIRLFKLAADQDRAECHRLAERAECMAGAVASKSHVCRSSSRHYHCHDCWMNRREYWTSEPIDSGSIAA